MAWVLRDVEMAALGERLARASIGGLVLAAALNVGHNVFRVWRWGVLLEPVRRGVGFRPMFTAVIIGYLFSWVVPGRLGEVVRPVYLAAREDLPFGPCLGSVVADRILDGVTVVVLFAVAAWMVPLGGEAASYAGLVQSAALVFAVLAVAAVVGMLLVASRATSITAWASRRGRAAAWTARSVVSLSHGVSALRSPRRLVLLALTSLGAWLTIALATWIGIRSCGAEFTFGQTLFIMPMLVLGVAVPTPGGAGSYHAAMKAGLLLFGVAETTAVGAGILVHATVVLPVIAVGLVLIRIERISWRDLAEGARRVRELGADAAPVVGDAVEGTR